MEGEVGMLREVANVVGTGSSDMDWEQSCSMEEDLVVEIEEHVGNVECKDTWEMGKRMQQSW